MDHGTTIRDASRARHLLPPQPGTPLTSAARDRFKSMRGQTLLEFALVVPIFFMLVCAVVDFGHVFYLQMTLQNAVQQAGRFAITGNHLADPKKPGTNLSRVNSIIATAQQAAPGLSFSNISISSKNAKGTVTNNSAGNPGDMVTVSLTTTAPLVTPMIARFFPGGGYTFTVSVTFMNEPFPPGQAN